MTENQTNTSDAVPGDREWELLLRLDERAGALHTRIREALRDAVRAGRLQPGDALPPSRRLAEQLGCSRWAVTEAYGQLVAEGYLVAVTGSGTTVAWGGQATSPRGRAAPTCPQPPRYDLAPGLPDLRAFPRKRWTDAVRAAVADVPRHDLGHPVAGGHPRLRSVLADYMARTRGADASPDQVLVTTSVTSGVHRLCRALRSRGVTAVACEDPGWSRLRDVVADTGLDVVPIPTDGAGIRIDVLSRRRGVGAVLVTPAHHFPGGAVLAPSRRTDLLGWAREEDALVLEDDYDAEYRYDRDPVATLQGMDPNRVVLMKSVSKMLSPAVGIGWMVVPTAWVDELFAETAAEPLPSTIDQLALARMLGDGGYDRHLRGGRARYRQRRDLLVRTIRTAVPTARITGTAAGLHLVLWLPHDTPAAAVVAEAAGRGLHVTNLDDYRIAHTGPPALVLGYGNIATPDVLDAVSVLTSAITAAIALRGRHDDR